MLFLVQVPQCHLITIKAQKESQNLQDAEKYGPFSEYIYPTAAPEPPAVC